MSALVVRAYNVLFGDAILVTVPDRDPRTRREVTRSILIDVGNVLTGTGGGDAVFEPVVRDIRKRLAGRNVDLYVMTHEHLDHVQGLLHASVSSGLNVAAEYAWLTASAKPGYYKRHPEARKRLELQRACYANAARYLALSPAADTPSMRTLMANNNPARTGECVDFLRKLAPKRTSYVHRRSRLEGAVHHPFREARLTVLAPEEDTADYYGRMQPMALMGLDGARDSADVRLATLDPPAGVDAAAFRRLLDRWESGVGANVLSIDRAANNTSIVFRLDWRGWSLLFTGDAEQRSWRTIAREAEQELRPVHFLKVGHHGSHNATPDDAILDRILPIDAPDRRKRVALVSTCLDTYEDVPHEPTVDRLKQRCDRVMRTTDVAPGESIEVEFEG